MLQAAGSVPLVNSPFPDRSQLVLAEKFLVNARLRSWIAISKQQG
jgi:hypothetical protein